MFGDGFAIWIATDRAKVGPVFGSVGRSDVGQLSFFKGSNLV